MSIDMTEEVNTKLEVERQAGTLKEQAQLLDLAHDAIMVRRLDGALIYWNRGAEQMYGYSRDEALQRPSHELLKTTFPRERIDIEKDLIANENWEGELTHVRRDGAKVTVSSRWVLKRDERGEPSAVLEINTDISARKEAEEARARKQEELIRAQALAIAELSTPLIPITDEILVMPIIGVMDSHRANQVMESLLDGLSSSRGKFAVIDITGVPVVDTHVANALIRAAHAARLLGADVILAGIRPEVAQTLVTLDADLTGITTRGTLQSAIAFALGRRSLSG
jgi:rsbT co-antagonist protein RsbR